MPMIEVATTCVVDTGAPSIDAVKITPALLSCESSACRGLTL